MERPSICDLPEEIIWEILLKLPVKILLRLKCVCKHWCTLIASPSFVNQHFNHDSNQERVLIRHDGANGKLFAYALFSEDMSSGYEEPDHLQMPDTVCLLGPVKGVFCVVGQSNDIALLNPATRQFKPLPLLHWKDHPHLLPRDSVIGFGLDLLSGVFKVVFIPTFANKETYVRHCHSLAAVYNSGSDSWRHLKVVNSMNSITYVEFSLCYTYLNGVYYWLVKSKVRSPNVLAFDMSSEKFHEIENPAPCDRFYGKLGLYDGSLAMLSEDRVDGIIIWIMKKEGCWTKCHYVVFPTIDWPMSFSKNHDFLTEVDNGLLKVYNIFTQKLRTVELRGSMNCSLDSCIFYYKESLACIGDSCKLWDTRSDFVKKFFK